MLLSTVRLLLVYHLVNVLDAAAVFLANHHAAIVFQNIDGLMVDAIDGASCNQDALCILGGKRAKQERSADLIPQSFDGSAKLLVVFGGRRKAEGGVIAVMSGKAGKTLDGIKRIVHHVTPHVEIGEVFEGNGIIFRKK